jgi:uncharacterized protein YgiM (DUF1202 family)
MSRRTPQLILFILTVAALSGCLASAQTANLYTDKELAVRAEAVSAQAQEIIEVTPAPTKLVTPFIPTASPTPSPTAAITPSPTLTLSPSPSPTFTVEEVEDKKAYLNAGSANLRTGPGTDYDIIREMEENTKLTVTGTCREWFRVETGGDTGFVLAEFVEFGSVPTAKPTSSPTPKPTVTPKPSSAAATQTPTATSSGSDNGSLPDANGYSAEELLLIAQVVHEEAKGSTLEAQAAVANVIYNRIQSSRFPNTVEGVIFQKSQFTVASDEDELRAVKPSSTAVEAVKQIFVEGDTFLPADVMYFRAASKGTTWSSSFKYYDTFGGNCFFIYIG